MRKLPRDHFGRLIGASQPMRDVYEQIDRVAGTGAGVLISGETGTGKELVAETIHASSRRSKEPFLPLNCGAVSATLIESELFGHERGSFTGAERLHKGYFERADHGTLFLDEITEMPADLQIKLLRVLESATLCRVGGAAAIRVDVRIVAATNADLESDIKEGRFRADLYYRLNVLQIRVPPLRDRPEDIVLLARAFAAEVSARVGRPAPELDEETLARLRSYPWPGNVRELRSVIERALILHPGRGLAALDLAPEPVAPAATAAGAAASDDLTLRENLNRLERSLLVDAHRRAHGVRREAARLLGIDPRNLAYYCRKHGLDPDTLGD